MKHIKPILLIMALFSTISTAFGAVDLKVNMADSVTSFTGTPLYDPLHTYILYGLGLVAFLGLLALIKCGGANFFGHIIGSPQCAAAGWHGAVSVIVFLAFFVGMIGWYQFAM